MAHAICLQDWITVQGGSNTVIQNEDNYVEVPMFQDGAWYLEVSNLALNASTINVDVQSAPTKDEVFFAANATGAGTPYVVRFTPSVTGVQVLQISRWSATATSPLGRFMRWKLTFNAATQSITFRLWASLNQAGWR